MTMDLATTDRARNWIVAACCCFINLTFYGVSRMSGIMLVATTHTFQVSRASAAVPFSLSTAVRNLAGVFVGQLGHRFGVGPVIATGCLIASLGSGLCFFAQDMQWLSICWGGIFGFGFGLSTCLLPLAINKNFVRHNGTASGISYSGAYLGSFIFPPAVVWLLDAFGLQGTFLVISGCVLNVLVAAILLREKKSHITHAMDQISEDSSSNLETVSVICRQLETGEMWKQNINRAFVASKGNLSEDDGKLYLDGYISAGNQSYLLQDPVFFKSSSPIDRFTKCNNAEDGNLHQPHASSHRHSLLSNILNNFKLRRSSKSVELKNVSSCEMDPPPYSGSSHFLRNYESFRTLEFPNSPENLKDASTPGIAKDVSSLPKKYLKKLLESGLLSKGKYKAKCKLKLQKLRKVLEAAIFRSKATELKDCVQTDNNVRLTSFKNIQSVTSFNSFRLSLPSKYFHLSTPHSISVEQGIDKEKNQSTCQNSEISVQQISTNKETTRHTSESGTEINTASMSKLSPNDSEQILTLSTSSHEQDTTSICDSEVKESLSFDKIPHPTGDFYQSKSSKSSTYDDSTSIDESEDIQSTYHVPGSSPDLFLQAERKNSACSRSKSYKSAGKAARTCCFDWIHMLKEPMFILISCTMSVQTFVVVCVVTTIEDFAKDIGIEENRTYYALMALSVSNLFGTLTLGSITDRGYISRHRFLSLCFLGMSLSLVALSLLAVSLVSLLCLVVCYGLLESGVIITFPILMKQFVKGERRQAVAIASSNMLSAPTVMLVPMLIGHFRDNIGCYSGLFNVLGGTSFICSFLWLVAPSLCKNRCSKKKSNEDKIAAVC